MFLGVPSCISGLNNMVCSTVKNPSSLGVPAAVFSIWTGSWTSSCRKLPPEPPVPQTGGFTSCPQNVGLVGHGVPPLTVLSTRHCTGLEAIGGRELSFQGRNFQQLQIHPQRQHFKELPSPPCCRLPLLFQVSLWLGAIFIVTGAEQIHGNIRGWKLVFSRFTARGSYLH